MTRDFLWQPAVYIKPDQLAYLILPGSGMSPIKLTPGWIWHWPLLSTVRVLEQAQTDYVLASNCSSVDDLVQLCEAVVCVSRDHHLFTIEGQLTVEPLSRGENGIMPGYMKQSPTKLHRHIQSLIRQALRKALAEYTTKQLESQLFSQLQNRIQTDLNFDLRKIDLQASQTSITSLSPYRRRKGKPART